MWMLCCPDCKYVPKIKLMYLSNNFKLANRFHVRTMLLVFKPKSEEPGKNVTIMTLLFFTAINTLVNATDTNNIIEKGGIIPAYIQSTIHLNSSRKINDVCLC